MDSVMIRYLTGWQFFFLLLIVIGLYIVYNYVIRRNLMKVVKRRGGVGFDFSFLIIERLIVLLVLFFLLAIFVLYLPVFGGMIAVVGLGIGYKSLVDIMRGIQLISEMELELGRLITIDNVSGIIYKLGWTGIFVTTKDTVQFTTYGELAKKTLRYQKANIPVVQNLLIKSSHSNISLTRQEELLNNQLFAHPMLSAQHKPVVKYRDGRLQVQLGVTDRSHLQSFVNQLEQADFEVIIVED